MNEAEGSRPAYSTARSASCRPMPVYSAPARRFKPSRAAQSGLRAFPFRKNRARRPSRTISLSIASRRAFWSLRSRGWQYDFHPDRIAKESEPATVVLCDGFGMRCISESRADRRLKSGIIRLLPAAPSRDGPNSKFVAKQCGKNLLSARPNGVLTNIAR